MAMAERKIKRRKPAAERREVVVKVLLTADEHETLEASARAAGLSLSAWFRLVALEATKRI